MNKLLPVIVMAALCIISMPSYSQLQLNLSGTQYYTNFNFTDANGERDDRYIGKFTGGYRIGYTITSKSGLYFQNSIGMRKAGASYNINNSNVDYDFQYAFIELGLGYHYKFNTYNSYGFYASLSPYYGHLTRGTQRILDENYDVRKSKDVSVNDFGINTKAGMIIPLALKLDLNVGLEHLYGISNLESEGSGQEAKNYGYGVSAGITFSIK